MEPGTGLTILGSAIGSAKLIEKLLGPTAEYLGAGVKNWTERRLENLKRIFSIAARRLGDQLDRPGSVPPKVLRSVIQDGSFCEDELAAEYFGGVLASSRSGVERDDRGITYTDLLSGMSTYQIRLHYILYGLQSKLFRMTDLNPGLYEDVRKLRVSLSASYFTRTMDIQGEEDENPLFTSIFQHSLHGLDRLALLRELTYGDAESMKKWHPGLCFSGGDDWFTYAPSPLGLELFLWGHGLGDAPYSLFYKQDIPVDLIEVPDSEGVVRAEAVQATSQPNDGQLSSESALSDEVSL